MDIPEDASAWLNEDVEFTYSNVMKTNKTDESVSVVTKKAKVSYEQYGLISRREEYDQLGPADSRIGCFGCCYAGEQDSAATSDEDLAALMNMMRKSIAKTDPANLAIHLAARYEKIRLETNENLQPGESPLPPWTAASILDHLRYHNADPELQTWHRITELQELTKIALNASIVKNPETGEVCIDEKQGKMYLEFVKQLESQTKSDPSKKLYYSGGNHFDTKSASEGGISFSGKNIISFWKKK